MTERIIDKLDRLGAEAEIKEMTPEIRRFALLVRQDVVAGWPKREWVGLTEADWKHLYDEFAMGQELDEFAEAIEAKLKEKNATFPPAVPDAIHHTDTSETLEYIRGWNDCRQLMLEMRKP